MRILSAILTALLLCPIAQAGEDVVFAEDFEQFDKGNWSTIKNDKTVAIVDGGRDGTGKCAQITATLGEDTGGYLYKMLPAGLDTAYLRFYVKFEAEHGYTHHFVRVIAYDPPTRWPQGKAGERPDGRTWFSTNIEPWGNWGRYPPPGVWRFYTYYPDMKRSPDGKYWGNGFDPDPPVPVERDRWICVEVMVKANTPGQADGEQALWIDGREVGRWTGIRWRDTDKLKINAIAIESYITEQAPRHNKDANPRRVNRVWFDDVVVSRTYVGPVEETERAGD